MVSDSHSIQVLGKEDVELSFTYGRVLNLKDVFYAHSMRKNLTSSFFLKIADLKHIIESDQICNSEEGYFCG